MAVSDTFFPSWPLSKQYLAAHYYLSEEKPISITEAQRAQLGSLHLFVSFGPFNDASSIPELDKCTLAEKKKRIEEWKALGSISRSTAMKKFIDILNCLFPNWTRYRKLHYEFEIEWANMQKAIGIGKSPLDVNPGDLDPTARRTVSRSLSPIQLSLRRPHKTVKEPFTKAIQAVNLFQKGRILPFLPQVPRLNAAKDASDTLYALKKSHKYQEVHNMNGESIYYRFPKVKPVKKEKNNSQDFFGSLLEEIFVEETSRSKPESKKKAVDESFPEIDLLKNIKMQLNVKNIQEMNKRLETIEKFSMN
jgi:hypothetical protein